MLHDLRRCSWRCVFFFFNDTATTEIYTLSLHDALPISWAVQEWQERQSRQQDPLTVLPLLTAEGIRRATQRSEEHTSELQSQSNLVCRLLLEKKNKGGPRTRYILDGSIALEMVHLMNTA